MLYLINNKNNLFIWYVSVFLTLLSLPTFVVANPDEHAAVKTTTNAQGQPQKFVLGVEDLHYFPLFDFKNAHDTFTTELFSEFGEQYGYQFEYYPMPVKRFGMWLFEQDIDLKFPDNSRWNESEEVNRLSKNITYSKPILHLVAGTITFNEKIKKKEDVKVLGTLLGFYPTKWIDEIKSGDVVLYESSSTLMLIQQLIRGQLDAIDIEPSVVNYYLNKIRQNEQALINRNIDYEVYSYHLSSLKHPYLIKDFDEFLVKNSDFVQYLIEKYEIVDHRPYLK